MGFREVTAASGGGVLRDNAGREALTGAQGLDIFRMRRDGETDIVRDFQLGIDRIDLSAYEVGFDQMMIWNIRDNRFAIEIRGERTIIDIVPFENPVTGEIRDRLDITDFTFSPTAPSAGPNIVFDTDGKDFIRGTPNPDVFIFREDDEKDFVNRFEDGKDKIDLSDFEVRFDDLKFYEHFVGRVAVIIGDEKVFVKDAGGELTKAMLTEEDFIFG